MKKNLLVLVERVSRMAFLVKNDSKRTLEVMLKLLTLQKKDIPDMKSITFDNGKEFSSFATLTMHEIKVFFCDPGAPYQKGQVERTNAILHKFIPKKSNFDTITDHKIIDTQNKLNNLPRKCLNFLTTYEVYHNIYNNIVAL